MSTPRPSSDALLTPRQLEVLELMATGLSNKEIAGVLGIAPATVKNHVAAVIDSLDVTNRTEATTRLHELGLGEGRRSTDESFKVDGFGSRPAIAVLPFDSFSSDPEHAFLADAIVEDLTTGLAKWRWFPVVSRNSAFAYKGQAVDVMEVSRALGVGYVIEGSVRSMGHRLRITVQVLEGSNARHLWAEKFDCEAERIHEELDEIIDRVVCAIEPALAQIGGVRTVTRRPEQLDAWENANRGMMHFGENSIESFLEAARFYDRSVAIAPEFPGAHSGLAYCRVQCHHHRVPIEVANQPKGFRASADLTERLDPNDPETHLATVMLRLLDGDRERALTAAERCVEVGPSNGWGYHLYGCALNANGRPEEARAAISRAFRLVSSRDHSHAAAMAVFAVCQLELREFAEAEASFEVAIREAPNLASGYGGLASCLMVKGKIEEAKAALARMKEVAPGYSPLRAYQFMATPEGFALSKATYAAIGWTEAEFE